MRANYTDLQVVADDTEREGHLTIGVLVDGVFVPIAQHKTGHVAQAVAAQADLPAPVVESEHGKQIAELTAGLESATAEHVALTKQVAAVSTKVNELAKAPAAAKGKGATGAAGSQKG